MQPNYLFQLNQFHRWLETHYLSPQAQLLWFKFIGLFNTCGWADWVQVDTRRLMMMVCAENKQTAFRARDALVEAGLLEHRKGKKGYPSRYRMVYFRYENRTENVTNRVTDSVTCDVPDTVHRNKQKENADENVNTNELLFPCVDVPPALRDAWAAYVDARRAVNDPISDAEAEQKLRLIQKYSPDGQRLLLRGMTATVLKNHTA